MASPLVKVADPAATSTSNCRRPGPSSAVCSSQGNVDFCTASNKQSSSAAEAATRHGKQAAAAGLACAMRAEFEAVRFLPTSISQGLAPPAIRPTCAHGRPVPLKTHRAVPWALLCVFCGVRGVVRPSWRIKCEDQCKIEASARGLNEWRQCVVQESNLGHQLLSPPANWCPMFASRTANMMRRQHAGCIGPSTRRPATQRWPPALGSPRAGSRRPSHERPRCPPGGAGGTGGSACCAWHDLDTEVEACATRV